MPANREELIDLVSTYLRTCKDFTLGRPGPWDAWKPEWEGRVEPYHAAASWAHDRLVRFLWEFGYPFLNSLMASSSGEIAYTRTSLAHRIQRLMARFPLDGGAAQSETYVGKFVDELLSPQAVYGYTAFIRGLRIGDKDPNGVPYSDDPNMPFDFLLVDYDYEPQMWDPSEHAADNPELILVVLAGEAYTDEKYYGFNKDNPKPFRETVTINLEAPEGQRIVSEFSVTDDAAYFRYTIDNSSTQISKSVPYRKDVSTAAVKQQVHLEADSLIEAIRLYKYAWSTSPGRLVPRMLLPARPAVLGSASAPTNDHTISARTPTTSTSLLCPISAPSSHGGWIIDRTPMRQPS